MKNTKRKPRHCRDRIFALEVAPGFEPGNQGFADPCLTTWLCHRIDFLIICRREQIYDRGGYFGAAYEARTRYLHLGKVALYQMS